MSIFGVLRTWHIQAHAEAYLWQSPTGATTQMRKVKRHNPDPAIVELARVLARKMAREDDAAEIAARAKLIEEREGGLMELPTALFKYPM